MNIKVKVRNQDKPIVLKDTDSIGSGGEGTAYVKNGVVYKIYHDISKMIPMKKFDELSKLCALNTNHGVVSTTEILAPSNILYDMSGSVIGYISSYADNTVPLASTFSNTFQQSNNINPTIIMDAIVKMIAATQFIHSNGCLIVDYNEFNVLIKRDLSHIYYIDVDSYQTPSFPATAIMASIRDYNSTTFSENTDWFSFGILSFQMLIGIHPYKGKNPSITANDFESRIKANISVFNKNTTLPSSARDLSIIPDEYKQWYISMFENGKRLPPPSVLGPIKYQEIKYKLETKTTNNFDITKELEFTEPILKHSSIFNRSIFQLGTKTVVDKKEYPWSSANTILLDNGEVISFDVENGNIKYITNSKLNVICHFKTCKYMFTSENSLYIVNDLNMIKININIIGKNIILSEAYMMPININSVRIYNNVIVSSFMNSNIVMIPYGEKLFTNNIEELKDHDIIAAKYENGICILVAFDKVNKIYSRFMIILEDNMKYKILCESDIDDRDVNFVSLSKVVIMLDVNNQFILFKKDDPTTFKVIKDDHIKGNIFISHIDNAVKLVFNNKFYNIRMK